VRVFQPEKSVRPCPTTPLPCVHSTVQMESRSASSFSGAHSDDVDYVAWNPTHPELFCSSSQKDRKIVFWDARRRSFLCLVYFPFNSLAYNQKAGTSNNAHSRYPRSRSTTPLTANPCFIYPPGTNSFSCLTEKTPMTPWLNHGGLRWTVLPYTSFSP
jgi:hypothetical protein